MDEVECGTWTSLIPPHKKQKVSILKKSIHSGWGGIWSEWSRAFIIYRMHFATSLLHIWMLKFFIIFFMKLMSSFLRRRFEVLLIRDDKFFWPHIYIMSSLLQHRPPDSLTFYRRWCRTNVDATNVGARIDRSPSTSWDASRCMKRSYSAL